MTEERSEQAAQGMSAKSRSRNFVLCVLVILIACATPASEPSPQAGSGSAWQAATDLTSGRATYTSIAASGTTLHAVQGDHNTYYRRSLDQGSTWQAWVELGPGAPYLEDPVAADGDVVAVAVVLAADTIRDFAGLRRVGDIYLSLSRDNGASWQPRRRLTTGAKALRLSAAVSGASIHVAWMDYRSGSWDIRYRRSVDRGATWEPEMVIAAGTNSVGAMRPTMAVDGGTIHLAWMDGRDNLPSCTIEGGTFLPHCTEVYYARSRDDGATWETARRLTEDVDYSGRPEFAENSSVVLILYDGRGREGGSYLGLLRSTDEGGSWTQSVLPSAAGDQTHAKAAGSDEGFGVAWLNLDHGRSWLSTVRSADGLGWTDPERVPSSDGAGAPGIALTADYGHIVWSNPNMKHIRRSRPAP